MRSPASIAFEQGVTEYRNRKIEAAIHAFDVAECLGHDPNQCAAYRWDCWMLAGNFGRAWQESAAISARGSRGPGELWDGEPFDAKRIIIRCLHGYGDALMFLRYACRIRHIAARVIVQTHPEMVSVVEKIGGVDQAITWSNEPARGEWDQQIEVTELPRAFRTEIASIPAAVPYIAISQTERAQSLSNLQGTGRPRVGLLWESSGWNPARTMRLAQLLPLLESCHCDWYSFQRAEARAQLAEFAARFRIQDTALHSPEIVDTAADLCNMDLFITVDTMAAHLAGALGTPVWTMLPFEADWRWMLDRSDSPWYPTMRLFRQERQGEWEPVVRSILSALQERLGTAAGAGCF